LAHNFSLVLILSRGKGIDKLDNHVIAVSNHPIHVVRGRYPEKLFNFWWNSFSWKTAN